MLVHAFLYANRNIYNPKSFESANVELPGQLSQLVIHGNDAIAGHEFGYKKGSRAPWNQLSPNFPSDKVSSLTVLINAKQFSLSLPFLVLSLLMSLFSLIINYLFTNITIDISLNIILSISPFL